MITFKLFSLIMTLLIFSVPLLVSSQQSPVVLQARLAAQRDAEVVVNQLNWRLFGFGMAFIGGVVFLARIGCQCLYSPTDTSTRTIYR